VVDGCVCFNYFEDIHSKVCECQHYRSKHRRNQPYQPFVDDSNMRELSEALKSIDLNEDAVSNQAFARYQRVGVSLQLETPVVELRQRIIEERKNPSTTPPFYFIDASSGSGKTQLAFALANDELRVIHLLLSLDERNSLQPVYRAFIEFSELFIFSLESDIDTLGTETDAIEVQNLVSCSHKLLVVKFIAEVLGLNIGTGSTVLSLKKCISRTKLGKIPVFVLDEVLSNKIGGKLDPNSREIRRFRLARNIFRSVGIDVILMGTNSCAANFVLASCHSRGSTDNVPWCRLITKLPSQTSVSIGILGATDALRTLGRNRNGRLRHQSLCHFFEEQFKTCLPWFIELFALVVNGMDDVTLKDSTHIVFDKILKNIAEKVYSQKPNMRSLQGLRGQICMHLGPHRDPVPKASIVEDVVARRNTSYFVSCHLACPTDDSCDLFVQEKRIWKSVTEQWQPRAYFRSPVDDSLLFLVLGGGNKNINFPWPFEYTVGANKRKLTVHEAINRILSEYDQHRAQTEICLANSEAPRRDGDTLEVLAGLSMEIASHCNGLGGSRIMEFIKDMATELMPCATDFEWAGDTYTFPNKFADIRVPYLSPLNGPWPRELSLVSGVRVATIEQVKNADRIDLNIKESGISGEAKNYENRIDVVTIRSILKRVPENGRVHFVFCSSLQKSYFQKTGKKSQSWTDFCDVCPAMKMTNVVKLQVSNKRQLSLVSLSSNIPLRKQITRVVVFIAVEDMKSSVR